MTSEQSNQLQAIYDKISNIKMIDVIYLKNISVSTSGSSTNGWYKKLTFSISDLYSNYKNITPIDIFINSLNGQIYEYNNDFNMIYDSSTGTFTISASEYGFSKITIIDIVIIYQ